jgi:hypothetical protein
VKGADGAVGREKTSTLLAQLQPVTPVIGGVNADFFLFAPPGVPAGALITDGRIITGPSTQPVLAFDSAGRPYIVRLRPKGNVTIGNRQYPLSGWNRATPDGLALFDSNWGGALDTAPGVIEVALSARPEGTVLSVDTVLAGSSVPPNGLVLVAGRSAPAELRNALLGLRPGERVRVNVGIEPWHPLEAVGGRPVLVQDSVIVPEVDTEGQPGFATGRHPRTAAGIAWHGRRLLLVVVDGRQRPYSDGMTLRELASLMLALGSRDAINLDGGGSSTLVWAEPGRPGVFRIANRPSDPAGERPVGDALAVVNGCRSRLPGSH